MPLITAHFRQPLAADAAQQLASQLTQLTARCLRKDPKVTVVRVVSGEAAGQWFVDGHLQPQPLCTLQIQITRGTNDRQDVQAWLDAVWSLVGNGAPPLPHYLSVVELDAAFWGFNGLSQQQRKELQA